MSKEKYGLKSGSVFFRDQGSFPMMENSRYFIDQVIKF